MFSILIWAIYVGVMNDGVFEVIVTNWKQLIVKLIFIANFIPGQLYAINGPWWFVSLIVQFYIIFPFMLYIYRKYNYFGLITLSLLSLILTAYLQPVTNILIPGTVLTHIPELSLGIFLALQKEFSINYFTILTILIIFCLSNLYSPFFYFGYLSALIILLIIFKFIVSKFNKKMTKYTLFIGTISMYIFYINGFMRAPWINFAKSYDLWYVNIFFCFIFIFFVVIISFLMQHSSNSIKKIYKE